MCQPWRMFRVFIVHTGTDNFSRRHSPVSERWLARLARLRPGRLCKSHECQPVRTRVCVCVCFVYSNHSRLYGCMGRRSCRCICSAAAAKVQFSWHSALSLLTIFISLNGNTHAYHCIFTKNTRIHARASHSSVCRGADKEVREHGRA